MSLQCPLSNRYQITTGRHVRVVSLSIAPGSPGLRIAGVKMPVMAVNDENQREQAGDYRSRLSWSAGKMEAVLRLLRGDSLEELSGELQVEAHRLAGRLPGRRQEGPEGSAAGPIPR
jgi:hypothetical protein